MDAMSSSNHESHLVLLCSFFDGFHQHFCIFDELFSGTKNNLLRAVIPSATSLDLMKYLKKVPHQLDAQIVANMTVGFNGAALAALVNEAALLALRQNDYHVTIEHFYQVKDKVIFGKKKLQMLSDKQKEYRITYQAAKVCVATYFDLPFEKLMLTNEQLTPMTSTPFSQQELEAQVKMLLAGVVACNIKYGDHSSSAQNDLQKVKGIGPKFILKNKVNLTASACKK